LLRYVQKQNRTASGTCLSGLDSKYKMSSCSWSSTFLTVGLYAGMGTAGLLVLQLASLSADLQVGFLSEVSKTVRRILDGGSTLSRLDGLYHSR
jgi:hypothetical protein